MKKIKGDFIEGFKSFGLNFNTLINLVILSIAYFLGIGLSSITAKLLNKHFLDLKLSRNKKSYWVKTDVESTNIADHLRQY